MLTSFLKLSLLLALHSIITACDSGKQAASQKQPAGNRDDSSSDSGSRRGDTSGDKAVFDVWCDKAGETTPVNKQLKEYYAKMCPSGSPSALLTSDLVNIAYNGSGTPEVKKLGNFQNGVDGKNTTTALFGVGIKLPISIKNHFDKVGPRQGDVKALEELAEAQGAEGEAELIETFKNDGKYHVRGWETRARNVKDIKITKIITETINRNDQFELESGQAYLYSQYVTESIESIKVFDMLTAGIQIGDDAYLLTVAKVVTDNKGIPAAAQDQIIQTARGTAKSMWQAAKDAQ